MGARVEVGRSEISIRQMEMIWAILCHGTMAKAALSLNISQPAISRMVRHAEDRTGLQFFERRGSKLIPTPELKLLACEFERVFANVDRVHKLTRALGSGWGRPLRIAAMPMIAETFLIDCVAELRADDDRVPVIVKLGNRFGVESDVLREDADLGLVHGVTEIEALKTREFARSRVVCLVPEGHPLATLPEIAPGDLAGEPIVSMGRNSPLSHEVEDAFERAGVARQIAVQIADSCLAARYAQKTGGIALVDPFFGGSMPLDGLVLRAFSPPIESACFVIYRGERIPHERERHLIDALVRAGADWTAPPAGPLSAPR